jgi:propanol-preferring alcohol dehydrogenase
MDPLIMEDVPVPEPGIDEILIRVSVCGVCHTELDEIEGRTAPPDFPVTLGHQVVGYVEEMGSSVHEFTIGERVGVAWIYSSCGKCEFCNEGLENLCPDFKATGRDVDGGYAEYMVAKAAYSYRIPEYFTDSEASPLFCAGAIGYRSLHLSEIKNGENLGLTGFGASAHLVLKLVRHLLPESRVYVFARSEKEREFSKDLGAVWAGDIEEKPAEKMHAVIDTTPVWKPIVTSMRNLEPGGRLVINAIRKEDFDKDYLKNIKYHEDLWMEREIKSVANVTTNDVRKFLSLAAEAGIKPDIEEFKLEEANKALIELKKGKIRGAKVLKIK